jgi:hypothetical protein
MWLDLEPVFLLSLNLLAPLLAIPRTHSLRLALI